VLLSPVLSLVLVLPRLDYYNVIPFGWHSVSSCATHAVILACCCTARLFVFQVWSRYPTCAPTTLAESSMANRLQAGILIFKCLHGLAFPTLWMNSILQSRSFESICGLHCHTHCLFIVFDYQCTVTELFQSYHLPPGTDCHSMSLLHYVFQSSALV